MLQHRVFSTHGSRATNGNLGLGQKVLIAPPHPHEPNVSAPPFPHYGLEHIGLTVDDVDAAVEELRAKGAEIAIGPLTRNPGLRLAFVRGPEGIMIELVQR